MKNIKFLTLTIIASLMLSSCLVDDEEQQIEKDLSNTPYIVGFKDAAVSANIIIDDATAVYKQPIDLISGFNFSNTPSITVSFEIDPSSTATEGIEYEVSGNTFSIPANRNFGTIDFDVYTSTLDPANPKTIVVNLLTTSNGFIANDQDQVTITLQGLCVSDLAGNYTSLEVRHNDAPNAVITEIGDGLYSINSMPILAFSGGNPVDIEFSDACGVLQFTDWNQGTLIGGGAGTVDPATGDLNFDSFVVYNGDDVASGIWFSLPASTYSPN